MFDIVTGARGGVAAPRPGDDEAARGTAADASRPDADGAVRATAADADGCRPLAPDAASAQLTASARALADLVADCAGWTADRRVRVLEQLDRATGAIAVARSRLLIAEREAGSSMRPGDRDFAAARARATRTGLGEARREERLADAMETMPAVAGAVGDGDLPLAHADALARAASRAGAPARQRLAEPETQAELVRLARRLPLRDFAAATERMIARWDPASLERGHAAQRAARFLHLSHQSDGTHLRGRLDAVAGAALRSALDGMGFAPDGTRTKEQADADALVAAVERGVSGTAGIRRTGRPAGPSGDRWDAEQRAADGRVGGSANRPTVCVLVPAGTVAEVIARRERDDERPAARWAGDAASTRAQADGLQSADPRTADLEPAVLDDGTLLPTSELTRFLCDSGIGRMVLDQDSVPLDLGRTERLFSATQRRAMIVRDRGCAWNGCDVPAAYCELHHIRWWRRDRGPTDLDNGVLLCSHHHHVVHAHDLAITRSGPPGRPDGGLWAEPQRYEFLDRRGRGVSLPGPDPGGGADPGEATAGVDEWVQGRMIA